MCNERVAQLVKESYPVTNINPHSIKFLGGFDDHIYYLKGFPVGSNEIQEYVFRVMLETDSNYYDALTKLILHIRKEGINVSIPVQSIRSSTDYTVPLKKSYMIEKQLDDDVEYTGLLLTYLPGNVLSRVQRSPRLLYNIGEYVGRLNTAMQVNKLTN